jgi:hypothetical protein
VIRVTRCDVCGLRKELTGQRIERYAYTSDATGSGSYLSRLYNTIVRRELRADETISEIMGELANDAILGTSDDEIPF